MDGVHRRRNEMRDGVDVRSRWPCYSPSWWDAVVTRPVRPQASEPSATLPPDAVRRHHRSGAVRGRHLPDAQPPRRRPRTTRSPSRRAGRSSTATASARTRTRMRSSASTRSSPSRSTPMRVWAAMAGPWWSAPASMIWRRRCSSSRACGERPGRDHAGRLAGDPDRPHRPRGLRLRDLQPARCACSSG